MKECFKLGERIEKLEGRIEKRKIRIDKLQSSLKEEKNKLAKEEETLLHLKYNDVLKRMQETGVSPDEALRAIANGVEENQTVGNESQREGVGNYEKKY